MDGYSISQVAERTGFSASTLRFYEQSGLVRPARTASGYRSYDDHHVELLAFIGRAKGFGLSLEEVADLLPLLDEERCAPVQGRLRELVDAKIIDAQMKIAELVAFTAELQRVAAGLAGHTPDGPCDDSCGCTSDHPVGESARVSLVAKPIIEAGAGTDPPIACSLSADRIEGRMAEWQSVLTSAVAREPIATGVRVRFAPGTDVTSLARLAAAEQDCCRFFTFAIVVDPAGVALEVSGPEAARPAIDALVGTVA